MGGSVLYLFRLYTSPLRFSRCCRKLSTGARKVYFKLMPLLNLPRLPARHMAGIRWSTELHPSLISLGEMGGGKRGGGGERDCTPQSFLPRERESQLKFFPFLNANGGYCHTGEVIIFPCQTLRLCFCLSADSWQVMNPFMSRVALDLLQEKKGGNLATWLATSIRH